MRKSRIALVGAALGALFSLCSCNSKSVSYKDGTYTGQSTLYESSESGSEADDSGYGVVTITIKDNIIVAAEFKTYEADGTLKDEEYYTRSAQADYNRKAKKAVLACVEYAQSLIDHNGLDGVDCISGATRNYEQFTEAVEKALDKAKE